MKKERPYNDRKWTKARFHAFIKSALRSASMKWGPKWTAINKAYVKDGKNPETGRNCKLHRCSACGFLFPKGEMRADHIEPVVPLTGFTTWDDYIDRCFIESDGFSALCRGCHDIKTAKERKQRKELACKSHTQK